MDERDLADLEARGIGITNLAARATRRADQISAEELREGGQRLERLVAQRRPRVVAVAGVTAYRTAFGRRRATAGRQPEDLAGAELWVLPNPSGLNAHETLDSLARAYAAAARAAGVTPRGE
jgi:TDG/mug DNA glycosylase family protein